MRPKSLPTLCSKRLRAAIERCFACALAGRHWRPSLANKVSKDMGECACLASEKKMSPFALAS
eukprot:6625384-Alexandrium_andersonii.AAC.1